MPRIFGPEAIGNASAQKSRGLQRSVGIHWPRKQSEPSRLEQDTVRAFPKHPGAFCQNSSKTRFQTVSGKKFRCNRIIAPPVKQVITALAGEYCSGVLRMCEVRLHVLDGQAQ